MAGIPASGVSAVLLNVTAVGAGAPGPGFMSVIPKPARVGDVFNDQGSYGAFPNTSNLNLDSADPTPNLVLARVGAGGKIRLYNYLGPTHVIADVAGWFGTGGAHTDGTGFTGVVPSRVLDSRLAIGTPGRQFAAGETRNIRVAGVAGIPTNAESVVVNVTMTGSPGSGYVTAYPTGGALPERVERQHRAGWRAGEHVGRQGRHRRPDQPVRRRDELGRDRRRARQLRPRRRSGHHDHAGAVRRQPVGNGTRPPFGENEARNIQIAGRGSVPANATAVIANVTAVEHHRVGLPVGVAGRCGAADRVEPQLPRRSDGAEPRDDEARCGRCDLDRQRPRLGPRPRRRDGLRRLTARSSGISCRRVFGAPTPRTNYPTAAKYPTTRAVRLPGVGGEE